MIYFYPEAYLPSNPYIPHYDMPKYIDYKIDPFSIQVSGNKTHISLYKSNNIPFFDLSRYDNESRDWIWYSDLGIKFRLSLDNSKYILTNFYDIDDIYTADNIKYEYDPIFKCISCKFYKTINEITSEYIFYQFTPIIIRTKDQIFSDNSDYNTFRSDITFSGTDTFDFYYDFNYGIHFNKDLYRLNIDEININFYINDPKVILKCNMSNNTGTFSKTTPTIESYTVKLIGQNLGNI